MPPSRNITMYPDIMAPGLFDDQEVVDLFSYMPHYDGTVAPSQIFTPPSPNDDWAIWFEVYDTCTSVSLALDETCHSADLEQSQDDKKNPKHGAGFEVPRETIDANQQAQTGTALFLGILFLAGTKAAAAKTTNLNVSDENATAFDTKEQCIQMACTFYIGAG